jgi:hypothetical protein
MAPERDNGLDKTDYEEDARINRRFAKYAKRERPEGERDDGLDHTDRAEDRRLARLALDKQNEMSFFQSEPPIPYSRR